MNFLKTNHLNQFEIYFRKFISILFKLTVELSVAETTACFQTTHKDWKCERKKRKKITNLINFWAFKSQKTVLVYFVVVVVVLFLSSFSLRLTSASEMVFIFIRFTLDAIAISSTLPNEAKEETDFSSSSSYFKNAPSWTHVVVVFAQASRWWGWWWWCCRKISLKRPLPFNRFQDSGKCLQMMRELFTTQNCNTTKRKLE